LGIIKKLTFPVKSYGPYDATLSAKQIVVISWELLTTTDETMRLSALDSALGFTSEKDNGKSQN
jgi:hypothetical protein